MEKDILRNELFEKYFEIEDGISASELTQELSFIPKVWEELHDMCEKNIKFFGSYNILEKVKIVQWKGKQYLIIKLSMGRYTIIDIEKMENITDEEFKSVFDEDFFVNNFDEVKDKDSDAFLWMYYVSKYNGNIQELISYYYENEEILSLTPTVGYRLEIGSAYTYFLIDFANKRARVGFETPDQFLYEHLFLTYDLKPFGLQDSQARMGVEKMKEMFARIPEIKIPKEVIPKDLYECYLTSTTKKQLIKK